MRIRVALQVVCVVVAATMGAVGCSPRDRADAIQQGSASALARVPPLDLSTPDRALRSYWRAVDVEDSTRIGALRFAIEQGALRSARMAVAASLGGDALASWRDYSVVLGHDRMERDILSVSNESTSRANVLARIRNVTPLAVGVTPQAWESERREKGELFRYILERDAAGWKIVQVRAAVLGDSTRGWENIFQPLRPHVPSLTRP